MLNEDTYHTTDEAKKWLKLRALDSRLPGNTVKETVICRPRVRAL